MNKYQEALDNLIKIETERTFKRIGTFFHPNCDTLQELVDKETPKKIVQKQVKHWIDYHCPSCNHKLRRDTQYKYCPHCGQKLDWSEENE